jgi:hypothetical protein
VRFTTRLVRALPVASGTYKVLICTDIYSQLQRFSPHANCFSGHGLAISTISLPGPSGPVPDTVISPGRTTVSSSSTAVFRFGSTLIPSTFECSLDGGPWLACASPQRYTGLVGGRHAFAVRAIAPSGNADPIPTHAFWIVDSSLPTVTLGSPMSGSTTSDSTPVISGSAGTAPGDSSTITVKMFAGSDPSGSPVQTHTAAVWGGRWSVATTQPLADGTYTTQAAQSDSAGNTGLSAPSTVTIRVKASLAVGGGALAGNAAAPTPGTYSIGGTVSGLSGTVVLQDNGGMI